MKFKGWLREQPPNLFELVTITNSKHEHNIHTSMQNPKSKMEPTDPNAHLLEKRPYIVCHLWDNFVGQSHTISTATSNFGSPQTTSELRAAPSTSFALQS